MTRSGNCNAYRAWEISIFIQAVVCLSSQLTLLFSIRQLTLICDFLLLFGGCIQDQGNRLTIQKCAYLLFQWPGAAVDPAHPLCLGGEPQNRHMVAGSPPVEGKVWGSFSKERPRRHFLSQCVMTKPVCYKKKKKDKWNKYPITTSVADKCNKNWKQACHFLLCLPNLKLL